MGTVPSGFTGLAGEHYVLFRFHARGLMAALAPPNAPTVDIIVLSPNERVTAEIQVKTSSEPLRHGWMLTEREGRHTRLSLFFALVNLYDVHHPVTYIVPSGVVADVVPRQHAAWLAVPKRGGNRTTPKADTDLRRIQDDFGFEVPGYRPGWMEPYLEGWDRLASPGHDGDHPEASGPNTRAHADTLLDPRQ